MQLGQSDRGRQIFAPSMPILQIVDFAGIAGTPLARRDG